MEATLVNRCGRVSHFQSSLINSSDSANVSLRNWLGDLVVLLILLILLQVI